MTGEQMPFESQMDRDQYLFRNVALSEVWSANISALNSAFSELPSPVHELMMDLCIPFLDDMVKLQFKFEPDDPRYPELTADHKQTLNEMVAELSRVRERWGAYKSLHEEDEHWLEGYRRGAKN